MVAIADDPEYQYYHWHLIFSKNIDHHALNDNKDMDDEAHLHTIGIKLWYNNDANIWFDHPL